MDLVEPLEPMSTKPLTPSSLASFKQLPFKNHTFEASLHIGTLEDDVNHVMGRGETSNVSGVPTLNRLLNDIDEVKGNHKKVKTEFDDFKKGINEKLDDEIRQRESDVGKLKEGQIGAEKRTEELKDTIKKVA